MVRRFVAIRRSLAAMPRGDFVELTSGVLTPGAMTLGPADATRA